MVKIEKKLEAILIKKYNHHIWVNIRRNLKTIFLETKKYFIFNPYDSKLKDKKKFFIFGTSTGGNLGDQAIGYAQEQFFEKYYPDYVIVEIPGPEVFNQIRFVKKILRNKDVVLIHGGGSLGNLYFSAERIRRKVIESFPNNKVIQLPQSYTFNVGKDAENVKIKSRKIYGRKQHDLTIVARETKSFQKFKELFKENNHILIPDIVLLLNEKKDGDRDGILLCLRADTEQVITNKDKSSLINTLKKKYSNVTVTDTEVRYSVTKDNRYDEINKKWEEYRGARVVITDRLHGMIFAVITGTPCIVFDNYNQKIRKTYFDWLQECNGIRFIDVMNNFNVNDMEREIEEITKVDIKMFNEGSKYQPLIDEINKCIEKA